ncbi:MAG TPA: glycosyltransferase family 39 protein [Bryobacteraceae bacterium]|jgi:4-amino-4-deoxy-L-arabinose transferase-like glycosyltransferase|nr:glycosyltransferase family 39 protein [Bryobacteraceae bacterium]
MTAERRRTVCFFAALFAVTLALRLCHVHILWADEDYHLAAGIQILHGKLLYRDLWYDKPPLAALVYAAMGALPGWPLRLFDALFVLAVSIATWRFARDLWGRREARIAAGLMAFFLNLDLPAAVIPIAPDMFLLLPHIVAIHCAWKGKSLAAGVWCGVACLFHTKGLVVLAVCALLSWPALPALAAGFAIPSVLAFAGLAAAGALPAYLQQVWEWSAAYARSSPELHPWVNGLHRTADWLGFHAALAIGAAVFWWENRKRERYWMAAWLALSLAGVALGARFFPRYFLQILPPMVLLASFTFARRRTLVYVAAAVLIVPAVRFGPRYATLAHDLLAGRPHQWADIALDRDSRAAAEIVSARKKPGDTLFVWGYRPGIFVYTRMPVASRFWDSQPLTGVPADRHLHQTSAVLPEQAAENRRAFAGTRPAFFVDSLSEENPRLAVDTYPELREWLTHYEVVGRTGMSVIYQARNF